MKYAVIAVAAAAFLAGCGTAPQQATPTVTVTEEKTVEKTVEPEPESDPDDVYMMLLAESGVYSDRQTSIEVGRSVCDALDGGYEPAVLALIAVDSGFTEEQAAGIVAAAIVAYCPWHRTTA
jgi:hypothetical protein